MPLAEGSKAGCDVAVVGGALAGAATAILLLRQNPGLKVTIVEKSPAFGRRVGEATVEISGYFLGHVLGLTRHLNHEHLVKQGMRFWFYNEKCQTLPDASEIGGRYLSRVPSYQVDRAVLDEEVLRQAAALGARVVRPARVARVDLTPGKKQVLHVESAGEAFPLEARWVVDASGVAALLSRQEGWWRANREHPTTAAWARWTGVKDWDGLALAEKYPEWAKACQGIRATATNHFVGHGWWAWCIPLKNGDVSVGVVFDERMVDWPRSGPLGERLKEFLSRHPVAREILAEARCLEGDVHWRRRLPYVSAQIAGDGFALVGDAAGFLDPFYSPGMDWVSYTATATADLVLAGFRNDALARRLEEHNRTFTRSYQRWFEALYKDKYEYMGDYELMRVAFLLDLGLYYLGVVSQPFKRGAEALKQPVFSTPLSTPFYHLMRTYNRRLSSIAHSRRVRGVWGRRNHGKRFMFPGFSLSPRSALPVLNALGSWAWLEATEGWRTWGWTRRESEAGSNPQEQSPQPEPLTQKT
jgi:flavin-dependent dehydrogenase